MAASEAQVRARLRERADQVSKRVPAPGEREAPRAARPRPQPAPSPAPKPQRPAAARTAPRKPASGSRGSRSSGLRLGRGRVHVRPAEYHNYQGIILAEFVAAELLVAMTPIAVRKNQPGLSPYVPRDMTKLLAIGLLFFLLELMGVAGRGAGRVGAWFGLLVLLTVGLNEGANVARVLDIFGGGTKSKSEAESSASSEEAGAQSG